MNGMLISRFRSHSSTLHQTCFLGVYHISITFPVEKNKQTNKQKRRQWPEMPFCSAIATILQHQDLLLSPISFGQQGCTCASTNLLLPTFRDNLFNMPYSISATLPEKLSLNGNFSYRLLIIVEKYQTYLRDLSHVIVHVNFTLIMIT